MAQINYYYLLFPVLNKTNCRTAGGERFKTENIRAAGGEHPGPGTRQPSARRRPCSRQEAHQNVSLYIYCYFCGSTFQTISHLTVAFSDHLMYL